MSILIYNVDPNMCIYIYIHMYIMKQYNMIWHDTM